MVQQLSRLDDGRLVLGLPETVREQYRKSVPLDTEDAGLDCVSEEGRVYEELCRTPDSFLLRGSFRFEEEGGSLGLAFDYGEGEEDYKLITLDPDDDRLLLQFRGGKTVPAEEPTELSAGELYRFTYFQEDSVGIFYLDDIAAFTVRLYGVSGKPLYLFAEDNAVHYSELELYTRN